MSSRVHVITTAGPAQAQPDAYEEHQHVGVSESIDRGQRAAGLRVTRDMPTHQVTVETPMARTSVRCSMERRSS